MTNKGAKGNACVSFEPGETKVLLDVQGCGVVNRMWMTTQRLPFSTLIPRKTGYHQSPVLKNEQLGLMGM